MSDFTPKTRLQKILCGVAGAAANAKTRIEKAAAEAVENAGGGGASNAPLEAEGTLVTDAQTGKTTITLDKTAGELYGAACAGKLLKLSTPVSRHDDESDADYVVDVTNILSFVATRIAVESAGMVVYKFEMRARVGGDGESLLLADDLAETDTVVFTEATGD